MELLILLDTLYLELPELALHSHTHNLIFSSYGTQTHSVWRKLGIPGPRPLPFLGNAHEIKRLGMAEAFRQWGERYGPVVGVFFMRRPMLVINDVNMLKQILITDFHNFTNRGVGAKSALNMCVC